jgi:hypothetical protein
MQSGKCLFTCFVGDASKNPSFLQFTMYAFLLTNSNNFMWPTALLHVDHLTSLDTLHLPDSSNCRALAKLKSKQFPNHEVAWQNNTIYPSVCSQETSASFSHLYLLQQANFDRTSCHCFQFHYRTMVSLKFETTTVD